MLADELQMKKMTRSSFRARKSSTALWWATNETNNKWMAILEHPTSLSVSSFRSLKDLVMNLPLRPLSLHQLSFLKTAKRITTLSSAVAAAKGLARDSATNASSALTTTIAVSVKPLERMENIPCSESTGHWYKDLLIWRCKWVRILMGCLVFIDETDYAKC